RLRGHGLPARRIADRGPVDRDHHRQPVRPDAGTDRQLRLGPRRELRRQRPAAARGRELRAERLCGLMIEVLPQTDLSVSTVAEIVRLALAPVFLLSGIGAFLNVLASRESRLVAPSRAGEPLLLASRGTDHDRWVADLKILDRRLRLIAWATGLSVVS